MLQDGDVVLDVGCGTGLITRSFAKRSQRVVAVDLNRWALCQMDGYSYVSKVQGDAECLPVQDGTIDVAIAAEVIEHLERILSNRGRRVFDCSTAGWGERVRQRGFVFQLCARRHATSAEIWDEV